MKILSIQYGNIENPYSHGGLAQLQHEVFKRLVSRHTITCRTGLLPGGEKVREIDGIKYIRTGKTSNKYINRLSYALVNTRYRPKSENDLVLIPWDRYAPVLLHPGAGCPEVLELNLDFFNIASKLKLAEPITRHLLKRNLRNARYIIAACEGVKKIVGPYTREVRLFEVIPGGVPEEMLNYPVDTGSEKYLLYIGRLDITHKGIDILLEAYKAAGVELPLVMAGDGIDRIKVEKMIKKSGLAEKVRTVGWVRGKEKYELIAHSLAVCIPSRVEGWGIVATEAAAMGKPAIGTRVVGLEESILDGKTGILVPKEDVGEFSRAIKVLVQDRELRRRLGGNAKEIAPQFSWEKIAGRREHFFHQVIKDFRQAGIGA